MSCARLSACKIGCLFSLVTKPSIEPFPKLYSIFLAGRLQESSTVYLLLLPFKKKTTLAMAEMNGRKFSSSGSGGKESGDALKNIKDKQGEINDNVYRCYEALCDLRTKKLDLDEDKESDRKMLDQVNAHRNTFQNSLLQLSGAVTNMLQNSRKNSRNLKKYKFQNLELEKELDEVRDELRNAEFRTPEDANDESAREKRKEKAKSAMTKLVLRNLEKKLNDSEARILMYKYGLRDYSSPHTTGEVCAEFDQTATYVNNLERAFCEVSLILRLKGLYLDTVDILFYDKKCISHLWCTSIILYNITSIAYNPHTDINPFLIT